MPSNRFSKRIVILVILLNVVFIGAIFGLAWYEQSMPSDAVVVAWFAFTTGELWTLSRITQAKVKEEGRLSGQISNIITPGIADEGSAIHSEGQDPWV